MMENPDNSTKCNLHIILVVCWYKQSCFCLFCFFGRCYFFLSHKPFSPKLLVLLSLYYSSSELTSWNADCNYIVVFNKTILNYIMCYVPETKDHNIVCLLRKRLEKKRHFAIRYLRFSECYWIWVWEKTTCVIITNKPHVCCISITQL